MFNKILVVTDGSDHGTRAVEVAADLAVRYGASLIVGHVLLHGEPPSAYRRMAEVEHLVTGPAAIKPDVKNITGGLVAFASQAEQNRVSTDILVAFGDHVVDLALRTAKEKGLEDVETKIARGDATSRILEMADDSNVDLIVLGSRGFGPLKGLIMGSVSAKITQMAKCACLTVK